MFENTKEKKVEREVQALADNVYNYLKQRYRYEDDEDINSLDEEKTPKLTDSDFERSLELSDHENILEKLKFMSIDNHRLREKLVFIYYDNEHLKETQEELFRELKSVKYVLAQQRKELAYLRHLTSDQEKQISKLTNIIEKQTETLKKTNGELTLDFATKCDCQGKLSDEEEAPPVDSKENVTTPTDQIYQKLDKSEETSWMQSVQNVFRKVKRDLFMSVEDSDNSDR
ncbi:hypothetical protein EG68_07889 [Paragonimus skrjabini miyazakii]|uniref:Uncharacterized protein n=1 Tax=Paragonimus skrjabini miyazakii TaxID=59628 RepID=A0A8S9YQR9_9TREM|nr:hypothetical protein EG68_07889 [Paragonimus skrjabini miyazakii]